MRTAALILVLVATSGNSAALAQSAPAVGVSPASEEIIVRGRRLTDLRFEAEQAQERAYAIFNEINSDDDFDVYCREERKYHSRATQRTCRPQFENRISRSAAQGYLANLFLVCPGGGRHSRVHVRPRLCERRTIGSAGSRKSAAGQARADEGRNSPSCARRRPLRAGDPRLVRNDAAV